MVIVDLKLDITFELDDRSEVDVVISELIDKIITQRGVVCASTTGPTDVRDGNG